MVEELEWVLVLSDVELDELAGRVLASQRPNGLTEADLRLLVEERSPERFNPVGNERLTAGVAIVLLVLTVVELGTILFGVHRFMSLHVFVGFVLIPPVLLKLGSTGWRFARYYTGTRAHQQLRGCRFVLTRIGAWCERACLRARDRGGLGRRDRHCDSSRAASLG